MSNHWEQQPRDEQGRFASGGSGRTAHPARHAFADAARTGGTLLLHVTPLEVKEHADDRVEVKFNEGLNVDATRMVTTAGAAWMGARAGMTAGAQFGFPAIGSIAGAAAGVALVPKSPHRLD